MKKLAFLVIALVSGISANAQLFVLSNGHVLIGDKKRAANYSASQRIVGLTQPLVPDSTLALTITSNGLYNTGGTIGFGDRGEVAIGEMRGQDNVLRLFAKSGVVYNTGGTTDVFYHRPANSTSSTPFVFLTKVEAPLYITDSDARLKTDVKPIADGWEGLIEVTPVTYSLKEEVVNADGVSVKRYNAGDGRRSYGLIAQEIQEIYPDLVYENEEGILGLDYQGFIPLLIEAVNRLSDRVEEQKRIINQQQNILQKLDVVNERAFSTSGLLGQAVMAQNHPNPFGVTTEIECFIPKDAASVVVYVYDLRGKQLKAIPVTDRGNVSVSVSAGDLEDGMYIYTLIVDGAETESRKMIVSR